MKRTYCPPAQLGIDGAVIGNFWMNWFHQVRSLKKWTLGTLILTDCKSTYNDNVQEFMHRSDGLYLYESEKNQIQNPICNHYFVIHSRQKEPYFLWFLRMFRKICHNTSQPFHLEWINEVQKWISDWNLIICCYHIFIR